jgi:hypothetical protein
MFIESNTHSKVKTVFTVKKSLPIFPTPAGMSLTKLSLAGTNFIPRQGEFGKCRPSWGPEIIKLFFTVY